jgi:mycobactin peptide synthetase MbtF
MTATGTEAGARPDIAPDIEDVMALSPLQEGLYSLTVLSGLADSPKGEAADDPYVIGMAADISGTLDVALLRDCAAKMLIRHPNLRASFFSRGIARPVQIVPSRVELPWRDIAASSEAVEALEADERRRPFDFEREPAIRFLLIELSDAHWRLVITAHHIVIDGWSLPVFIAEMMILYRAGGNPDALPVALRPYRDYIGWLASRDQQASQRIWREHLAELPGPTLLAAAFGGGDVGSTSRLPRRTELPVGAEPTDRVVAGARSRGITLNTLLQMAWAVILARLTDRDDVVFGVTVSGRPAELTGVETMIGLFINTVPLRVRLDATATVGEQCLAIQRDSAMLREHSYLGHAQLRALGGVGEMYDTLLVYENFPTGGMTAGGELTDAGVTFRPAAVESLTHFPIVLAAHMADDGLVLMVEVIDGALGGTGATALGNRLLSTAEQLLALWDRPLREVGVLLPGESAPLLGIGSTRTATAQGIHTRFAAIAASKPDDPALTWTGGTLSYRELDAAANGLARALTMRGAASETPVAIKLSRSPNYIVAILAVLKTGAAYVPLEPGMPAERVNSILRQTGAAIVIDDNFGVDLEAAGDFRPVEVDPGQAAYVVFTSGTTGEPKGVIGTHAAIGAYADDHLDSVLRPAASRLGRPLRVAHAWSFAFDAAWQPLVALLDGHAVHLVDEQTQTDAEALVAAIAEHGIDMIDTTPSMFAQLRSAGLLTRVPLAALALGGEALGGAAWSFIRAECNRAAMTAFNCYGPTETTVEAVVAAIDEYDEPSIGRPTRHTRGYVLDSALRAVPYGVTGELYLGGAQLARGYLGRAAETAQRFLADPFAAGERMYRTGDLVRRQPDGSLRYVGRADAQVKIRGHRVEPGEIAVTLESLPGVRQATVLVQQRQGVPRLTAYVAVSDSSGRPPSGTELRRMLVSRLPRYMVPQRITVVDDIPLTANGKLDEAALVAADSAALDDGSEPATATESALADLIAEILQVARIDPNADFLDLGLDSIVALSVVQSARRRGIALRARLVMECGSIRELAAAIDAEAARAAGSVPDEQAESGPIPLLANAHWLYEYGDPRRLAQAEAIRLPEGVTGEQLRTALAIIVDGHEVLRSRLDRATMTLHADRPTDFLTEVSVPGDLQEAVGVHIGQAIDGLDPERGKLLAAAWLRPAGGQSVLVLAAHVLAVDPVSWQVVLGELDATLQALIAGKTPARVREHTSYRRWAAAMTERAETIDSEPYWAAQLDGEDPDLGKRRVRPDSDRAGGLLVRTSMLDLDSTARLLSSGLPVFDVLVAAASRMVTRWRQRRCQPTPSPLLALETHGRADALFDGNAQAAGRVLDTTDTVGLLSAIYPLRVDTDDPLRVRELLSTIPGDGVDYGLLRYLRGDTASRLAGFSGPQLLLNYLGRAEVGGTNGLWLDRGLLTGISPLPEPELAVRYELGIVATVLGSGEHQVLVTQWRSLPDILDKSDIAALQALWTESLKEMAT